MVAGFPLAPFNMLFGWHGVQIGRVGCLFLPSLAGMLLFLSLYITYLFNYSTNDCYIYTNIMVPRCFYVLNSILRIKMKMFSLTLFHDEYSEKVVSFRYNKKGRRINQRKKKVYKKEHFLRNRDKIHWKTDHFTPSRRNPI